MRLHPAAIGTALLLAALTGCGGSNGQNAAPAATPAAVLTQPAAVAPQGVPAAITTPAPAKARALLTDPVVAPQSAAPAVSATPTPKPRKPVSAPASAPPAATPTPKPPTDHPAPVGQTCPAGYHFQYGGTIGGEQKPDFCAAGRQHTPCTEEGASGIDILYTEEVCHNGTWDHPPAH